jgi:hypothetical protein
MRPAMNPKDSTRPDRIVADPDGYMIELIGRK